MCCGGGEREAKHLFFTQENKKTVRGFGCAPQRQRSLDYNNTRNSRLHRLCILSRDNATSSRTNYHQFPHLCFQERECVKVGQPSTFAIRYQNLDFYNWRTLNLKSTSLGFLSGAHSRAPSTHTIPSDKHIRPPTHIAVGNTESVLEDRWRLTAAHQRRIRLRRFSGLRASISQRPTVRLLTHRERISKELRGYSVQQIQ